MKGVWSTGIVMAAASTKNSGRMRLLMPKHMDYVILIYLLSLLTFSSLFILRTVDDNNLTRWQWVFAKTDPTWVFSIFIIGTILA